MPSPRKSPGRVRAEELLLINPRPLAAFEVLKEEGFTTTLGHVRQIKQKMGNIPTVNGNHHETLPWVLARQHQNHYPALMLRALSRRQQGLPLASDPSKAVVIGGKLDRWLATLARQDKVIHYTKEDGFVLVPRRYALNKWDEREPVDPPWIRLPQLPGLEEDFILCK